MLGIAREYGQCAEAGGNDAPETPGILYLNQDMREFELYGTVAAVVSLCDSMNYITSEEELSQVFRLVNNYLIAAPFIVRDIVHKDIINGCKARVCFHFHSSSNF